jgi:hypothetical protein
MKSVSKWLAVALLVIPFFSSAATKLEELPSYASGAAPDCPVNEGKREYRSNTIKLNADEAYILGTAVRQGGKCESTTALHLLRAGHESTILLQHSGHSDYRLVDFSSDGSQLLIYSIAPLQYPDEQFRNVDIAKLTVGSAQDIHWINTWDLFGWNGCDATVEPQGFTQDGRIAVIARPSVMQPPRRKDCVTNESLYVVDLDKGTVTPAPGDLTVKRYVLVPHAETMTCASDPDVVAECFTVHGRLSFWNGSPTARIWWIGTKHMLGVSNEVLPENVAQYAGWDTDVYGDFRVCPFTKAKTGEMQSVCVDSAKNLVSKRSGDGKPSGN